MYELDHFRFCFFKMESMIKFWFRILLIGELVKITAFFEIVAHHELSQFEDCVTKLCFLLLILFNFLKVRLNCLNQLDLSLSYYIWDQAHLFTRSSLWSYSTCSHLMLKKRFLTFVWILHEEVLDESIVGVVGKIEAIFLQI